MKPEMMRNSLKQTAIFLAALLAIAGTNATAQAQSSAQPEIGDLNIVGFMQQTATYNPGGNDPFAFSIYRARVGVAGPLTDRISVNVITGMMEPPNRSPQLVNAFVDFSIDPRFTIRAGQFLIPFGLEGPEPITLNPMIERALTTRRLNTARMFRDIGVQAHGSIDWLHYAVAVVNGRGANVAEHINPKDVVGHIGFKPMDALDMGLSAYIGNYQPTGSNDVFRRFRLGADLTYQVTDHFQVRGEYIVREDDRPAAEALTQQGAWLAGWYQFNDRWQGVLRLEFHDPDTSHPPKKNHLTAATAGFNYILSGGNRISVNYEFRNDQLNTNLGDLITLQLQVVL